MSLRRIAVYCGSKTGTHVAYMQAATHLGALLARRGLGVVYGGARVGTMGAVADAALAAGGEVEGVMPRSLIALEVGHEGLTRRHEVDSMHERKVLMLDLADAVITMPGGYGSHDELFEAVTWLQLGIHSKPVGLLNVRGYYDGLLAHLDRARDEGFLAAEHRAMLLSSADPEDLIEQCEAFAPPARSAWLESP